ncbi:MAG: S-layer homology domain-containing protein [Clostridia bacterium]|nr:S-layer homology domain-containing protein [Clostridia bacterium]
MKKFIAYILCMLLLLSAMIISGSAFAVSNDFNEYDAIVGLGFMDLYATGNFENGNSVSRAEFAEILCKVANVPVEEGTADFVDVNSETIKKDYIYTAVKTGLMQGKGNGIFAPDEFITFNQAVKPLVTLLGYDKLAKEAGGYPIGYLQYAAKARILSGFNSGDENQITREQLANLIYNALDAKIWEMDSMSSMGEFSYKEGITLLEAYHGILSSEGVVETNDITSVNNDKKSAKSGCVVINSNTYTDKDGKAKEILGQNVKFYYRENEYEQNELVCLIPKNNRIWDIEADSIIKSKSSLSEYFWYDENETERKAKLSETLKVIYNVVFYFECLPDDLFPKVGDVKLIDNNSDNIFDIAVVNDYELFFVSHTNINSGSILEKNGSAIVLKDYECVQYEKDKGIKTDFAEIVADVSANDVLLVAKSKQTDYYIKILSSSEKISETFVSATSEGEYLTKKAVYELNPYVSSLAANIRIGSEYTLYLDAKGFIADIEISENKKFAYIVDVKNSKKRLTESLAVKLYTTDGVMETFTAANRFEIVKDGEYKSYNGENIQEAYKQFLDSSDNVIRQLVLYEVNDMKQLVKIELPKNAIGKKGVDGLALNLDGYYSANFDGVLFDDNNAFPDNDYNGLYSVSNAVMFIVPESSDSSIVNNEGLYSFKGDTTYMKLSRGYDVLVYNADDDYNCEVVVYKTNVGSSSINLTPDETVMFVIKSINDVLTENGDVAKVAAGYHNGAFVEYKIQDKDLAVIGTLKTGDALLVSVRADRYIDQYKIAVKDGKAQEAYPISDRGIYYFSSTTNSAVSGDSADLVWDVQNYVISGKANRISKNGSTKYNLFLDFENIDKYHFADNTPDDIINNDKLSVTGPITMLRKFIFNSDKDGVVYYDRQRDKMWLGNYDEIEPGDTVCLAGYRLYYNSCLVIKN